MKIFMVLGVEKTKPIAGLCCYNFLLMASSWSFVTSTPKSRAILMCSQARSYFYLPSLRYFLLASSSFGVGPPSEARCRSIGYCPLASSPGSAQALLALLCRGGGSCPGLCGCRWRIPRRPRSLMLYDTCDPDLSFGRLAPERSVWC